MSKNKLTLDTSGFDSLLTKLYRLEHENSKSIVEESLRKVGEKVNEDTRAATAKAYLPAHGEYSHGTTSAQVISGTPQITWEGFTASLPVGFDFNKPGAGGFLIAGRKPSIMTGTPRMAPDKELYKIYRGKTYMSGIQRVLWDELFKRIYKTMEG